MRRLAGILVLSLSLAGLAACSCETRGAMSSPEGNGLPSAASGAETAPAASRNGAPRSSAPPAAPQAGGGAPGGAPGGAGTDPSPLGLFTPVLPTLGVDTHSSECDPFDDPYEVCL